MRALQLGVATVMVAALVATTGTTGTPTAEVYRSAAPATSRMIVTGGSPYKFTAVTRQSVSLAAGDTVLVTARGQVTTEQTYNVMIANFLKVSTSPSNVHPYEGVLLERPMGHNFNRDVHHFAFSSSGAFTAPAAGTYIFTLVGYSASTAVRGTVYLVVNYAAMTLTIFRAE